MFAPPATLLSPLALYIVHTYSRVYTCIRASKPAGGHTGALVANKP